VKRMQGGQGGEEKGMRYGVGVGLLLPITQSAIPAHLNSANMIAYLFSGTKFKGNTLYSPSTPTARANAEKTAPAPL
jgi:hypothetical protein